METKLKITPKPNGNFTHVIDWSLVKNIDDVIQILKCLDMKFNPDECNKGIVKFLTPIESKY